MPLRFNLLGFCCETVTFFSRLWHLSSVLRESGEGHIHRVVCSGTRMPSTSSFLSKPLWAVPGPTISVFIPHPLCPPEEACLLILYRLLFKHNQRGNGDQENSLQMKLESRVCVHTYLTASSSPATLMSVVLTVLVARRPI